MEKCEGIAKGLQDDESERFVEFLKKEDFHFQNIKDEYKYMQQIMKELEKGEVLVML